MGEEGKAGSGEWAAVGQRLQLLDGGTAQGRSGVDSDMVNPGVYAQEGVYAKQEHKIS